VSPVRSWGGHWKGGKHIEENLLRRACRQKGERKMKANLSTKKDISRGASSKEKSSERERLQKKKGPLGEKRRWTGNPRNGISSKKKGSIRNK